MKNYYSLLGVLPTAELVVIKAAYRALCQMYHPDKYEGDKTYGEALIKEYNEAWSVLSDVVKRKEYDEQFSEGKGTFGASSSETSTAASFRETLLTVFPELETVGEYYPDIWETIERLKRISRQLASGFVAALLEQKAFNERNKLSESLTQVFFTSYFGKNKEILKFAELLVEMGEKEAALELNRAVNVFGAEIEHCKVISRIKQKYDIYATVESRDLHNKIIEAMFELQKGVSNDHALLDLVQPIRRALNISIIYEKSGVVCSHYSLATYIIFKRGSQNWRMRKGEIYKWVYEILMPMAREEFGLKTT